MSMRKPPRRHSGRKNPSETRSGGGSQGSYWLHGAHAVAAALSNPAREFRRLCLTKARKEWLGEQIIDVNLPGIEWHEARDLDKLLGPDAVHQGVAALVAPLPESGWEELEDEDAASTTFLMLDQVTDPHNIGAILRSAAAFGAAGVIIPQDHSPAESGTLAKTACGALETVPLIRVVNLSRELEALQEAGYWCIGFDGDAKNTLHSMKLPKKLVLVFGSEGKGLRRLVGEHCDELARLPILPAMESLNVSNAVAVALYESFRQRLTA